MFVLQYKFISLCAYLALSKSVEFYLRNFLSPDQAAILRARPNISIHLRQSYSSFRNAHQCKPYTISYRFVFEIRYLWEKSSPLRLQNELAFLPELFMN